MPASSAASAGSSSLHAQRVLERAAAEVVDVLAEVGARRGLDAVGAVAEIDRVEVLGDDLFLRPLVGQLVGERRLAQLLEDRAVRLRLQRVLDELLLDRGGALDRALVQDVLDEGARDAADVDAAVAAKALVLDRDHRVLDDLRDLTGGQEDLVLAAQHPQRAAEVVEQHRVARVVVLRAVVQRGQVGGDGHEHAEHERDQAEQHDRQEDQEEAKLLQARPAAGGRCG